MKNVSPATNLACVERVHDILISKLYNCRCNEFLKSTNCFNLIKDKKTISACIHCKNSWLEGYPKVGVKWPASYSIPKLR